VENVKLKISKKGEFLAESKMRDLFFGD